MQRIFIFPDFQPDALFCFSSREFDASKNLPLFLDTIGVARDRHFTLEQVHGNRVFVPRPGHVGTGTRPEADSLVTDERGLALVIRTADCVPVFFLDREKPAIGLCHAGWRGAQKKIVSKTIEVLRGEFHSRPESLKVALGPSICQNCYEVGEEFEPLFPGFVERRGRQFFFNLRGALKRELEEAGVQAGSIRESEFCTSCLVDQFFSARKEGMETGRLISAAVLK